MSEQTGDEQVKSGSSAAGRPAMSLTPMLKVATTAKRGQGGIMGVKVGMTRVFTEAGDEIGVTVIALRPNVVTQVKTKEKEGYCAVQVGLQEKRAKSANKCEKGHVKKVDATGFYRYTEIRLPDQAKVSEIPLGSVLTADFIKEGDFIDVTAVTKGKGFQGVIKRHNFAGGMASHGASLTHRMPGSIGNRTDPGKVFKNRKMAGHMGHVKMTILNLQIVKVDQELGAILVKGPVPGSRNAIVRLRKAIKKAG